MQWPNVGKIVSSVAHTVNNDVVKPAEHAINPQPHRPPMSFLQTMVNDHQFNWATPDINVGPKTPYPPLNRGISFNGAPSGLPNPSRGGVPFLQVDTNLQPLPDFTVTSGPHVLPTPSAMHGIYQGPAYFKGPRLPPRISI